MREEISVLIVDDNIDFGNLLNAYISQQEDMKIVGTAKDGLEAIEYITSLEPDIVILDIVMPNLDGIGVLEKMATIKLNKRPSFIVLSAIGQDIFIQKAISLGAEYYIVKPFDISVLVTRVRQIYKEKYFSSYIFSSPNNKIEPVPVKTVEAVKDIEVEVTNLMHDVGIPPHMIGYQYLREAIIISANNTKAFNSITKVLYPAIAEKFSTTPQKVERAIRNCIEKAWIRGNPDSVDSLFGYTINYNKGKPTNSEFIAMMADKIKIGMK